MRLVTKISAIALFALIPVQALAIDSTEQVIMKCRTNAVSTAAQVTCLEEALRARAPATEAQPSWSGITETGQMPAPQPYTRSQAGTTTSYPGAPSGLGSEQVRLEGDAERERQKTYLATESSRVIDFAYNSKDRIIVILANGQVWKQRDGDVREVKLKDGDSPTVVVRRGAVTGYRMAFPDLDREITVSRLK